ncbi:accessory Sec system protein Asp1 [Levilactobacillus zymae]|uniref:Accessory Sec system protein Asp1 n=1 Tax=Levilactobacillus zymae TaxID=267363 RepID=A0ABQ0WUV5_9LACO|nr:accessory Sec system protein Asp1 [Levilactobacillus zymae]KRL07582.1 hypothetical protein FD38_GL000099 [Levilactobacillus zymae DSM 19395]QFR62052.1 accessory Sec system protein Asp1 [Levilactobacillus zymae]GEO71585.1 accessory Sec system protein Asp1 [Levilactobacillus zymae]
MTVIIPAWSRSALRLTDNPIVKLAQLFMHNQLGTELLLLQPLPWLRYQLQANHLTTLPWWNVFDDLQQVHQAEGLPLGLEDLDLPRGTQFVYLADKVLLVRNQRIQGEVTFHAAGFVSQVTLTNPDRTRIIRTYDDRGFCSTQTTYDHRNTRLETLWFNPATQPVMRRTTDNHVDLLAADGRVTRTYASLEELIIERVQAHLADRDDLIISAADPVTASILTAIAQKHRVAYLLATRVAPTLPDNLFAALERVIAPTQQMAKKFRQVNANLDVPVDVVSPYATTLSLGNSTELPETTIVWAVNYQPIYEQAIVTQQLTDWLVKDERHAVTVIATSKVSADRLTQQFQQHIIAATGIAEGSPEYLLLQSLLIQLANHQSLTQIDQLPAVIQTTLNNLQRIHVRHRLVESDRQEILGGARLLIDLGEIPNLQLQIAAISAGIPQINRVATGYVADHENGLIVSHLTDLPAALDFYLATLIHWNESLVKSINYLENLAEPKLLAYWKGVITHGEHA